MFLTFAPPSVRGGGFFYALRLGSGRVAPGGDGGGARRGGALPETGGVSRARKITGRRESPSWSQRAPAPGRTGGGRPWMAGSRKMGGGTPSNGGRAKDGRGPPGGGGHPKDWRERPEETEDTLRMSGGTPGNSGCAKDGRGRPGRRRVQHVRMLDCVAVVLSSLHDVDGCAWRDLAGDGAGRFQDRT